MTTRISHLTWCFVYKLSVEEGLRIFPSLQAYVEGRDRNIFKSQRMYDDSHYALLDALPTASL